MRNKNKEKAGLMRWKCRDCFSKCLAKHGRDLSTDVKEIRYQCTNTECSASFVVLANFDRYLNPGVNGIKDLLKDYIEKLTPEERKALFEA